MSATKFALGIRSCVAILGAAFISLKYACGVKGRVGPAAPRPARTDGERQGRGG
jgi:hypothetical protein